MVGIPGVHGIRGFRGVLMHDRRIPPGPAAIGRPDHHIADSRPGLIRLAEIVPVVVAHAGREHQCSVRSLDEVGMARDDAHAGVGVFRSAGGKAAIVDPRCLPGLSVVPRARHKRPWIGRLAFIQIRLVCLVDNPQAPIAGGKQAGDVLARRGLGKVHRHGGPRPTLVGAHEEARVAPARVQPDSSVRVADRVVRAHVQLARRDYHFFIDAQFHCSHPQASR